MDHGPGRYDHKPNPCVSPLTLTNRFARQDYFKQPYQDTSIHFPFNSRCRTSYRLQSLVVAITGGMHANHPAPHGNFTKWRNEGSAKRGWRLTFLLPANLGCLWNAASFFFLLCFFPPTLQVAAGKVMDDQYLHRLLGRPIGKVSSFTKCTGWNQSLGVALWELDLDRLIECLMVSRCRLVARQHEMNECSAYYILWKIPHARVLWCVTSHFQKWRTPFHCKKGFDPVAAKSWIFLIVKGPSWLPHSGADVGLKRNTCFYNT